LTELDYERIGPISRFFKRTVINPLINWILPARFIRWVLRVTRSEMAEASWANPGGWKSMVLSYREDIPPQVADRFLVRLGAIPIALRNRRKLATEILARLIRDRGSEGSKGSPTNVVCLGAGPGMICLDAIQRSGHPDCRAYLIDLNPESFPFGQALAESKDLAHRVEFIHGDVTHYRSLCKATPHVVKMIGIIEYLPDAVVLDIARAIVEAMPADGVLVANSLTRRHGTDRFFRRIFDLHMIHRTADQVGKLLGEAGLATEAVFTEPLGVYDVLVCRKK
jgi:SAM-dependent methyltransferase